MLTCSFVPCLVALLLLESASSTNQRHCCETGSEHTPGSHFCNVRCVFYSSNNDDDIQRAVVEAQNKHCCLLCYPKRTPANASITLSLIIKKMCTCALFSHYNVAGLIVTHDAPTSTQRHTCTLECTYSEPPSASGFASILMRKPPDHMDYRGLTRTPLVA